MKRRSKILIVLLSAIFTIGILLATVGKPPYAKYSSQYTSCERMEKLSK